MGTLSTFAAGMVAFVADSDGTRWLDTQIEVI